MIIDMTINTTERNMDDGNSLTEAEVIELYVRTGRREVSSRCFKPYTSGGGGWGKSPGTVPVWSSDPSLFFSHIIERSK